MAYFSIAGLQYDYQFINEKTADYFREFLTYKTESAVYSIKLTDDEIQKLATLKKPENEEFYYVFDKIVNTVLLHDMYFYHGVAFSIRGKIYLLTADSGVGKTTQYLNLKKIYGDEIEILNGDKPVLQFIDDNVFIHSSPWMGKERYGRNGSGRLEGIIVLKQGKSNIITQFSKHDAIIPILGQFLYKPDSTEEIEKVCRMTENIIQTIPVWFYTNTGTLDSSRLLYDTLIKYQEGKHE